MPQTSHLPNESQRQPRPGIGLLALLALLAALVLTPELMSIEQPRYEVVERAESGALQLRSYMPFLVAETVVDGDLDRSRNEAFRRLAGYIFGDNRSRGGDDGSGEAQKIAMTSPVHIDPVDGGWRMTFIMPAEHTLETLPEPMDPAVRLRRDPGGLLAAVRFSGRWHEGTLEERSETLRRWIDERGWTVAGEPFIARYDPPWTPPEERRNEVLIPVRTR